MADTQKQAVADGLSRLLADSYTLYLKTHNYHWNVTGPQFHSLHTLFETQYTELALAVDEIAERIRTLGFPAPGSYSAYAKLTGITESDGPVEARAMIENLLADQETVAESARAVIEGAESLRDEATVDLLVGRINVHEKNAWMLRSSL